jgi:chromosome segregation protein
MRRPGGRGAHRRGDPGRGRVGWPSSASDLAEAQREAQELQQSAHAVQVEAVKLGEAVQRYRTRRADRRRPGRNRQPARKPNAAAACAEARCPRLSWRVQDLRAASRRPLEESRKRDAALREQRTVEQALARELQESRFAERECAGKLEEIGRNARGGARAARAHRRRDGRASARSATPSARAPPSKQLQQALAARQQPRGTLATTAMRWKAPPPSCASSRSAPEDRAGPESPARRIGDLRLKAAGRPAERGAVCGTPRRGQRRRGSARAGAHREVKEPLLQGDIARLAPKSRRSAR